jgi:hypothetical protein
MSFRKLDNYKNLVGKCNNDFIKNLFRINKALCQSGGAIQGNLFSNERHNNINKLLIEDKTRLINELDTIVPVTIVVDDLVETLTTNKGENISMQIFKDNSGRHNEGVGPVKTVNGNNKDTIFVKKGAGADQFVNGLTLFTLDKIAPHYVNMLDYLKTEKTDYLFMEKADMDVTSYIIECVENVMKKNNKISEFVNMLRTKVLDKLNKLYSENNNRIRHMQYIHTLEVETDYASLFENIMKTDEFKLFVKDLENELSKVYTNLVCQIMMSDYYMFEYLALRQVDRKTDNYLVKKTNNTNINYKINDRVIQHNNIDIEVKVADPEQIGLIGGYNNKDIFTIFQKENIHAIVENKEAKKISFISNLYNRKETALDVYELFNDIFNTKSNDYGNTLKFRWLETNTATLKYDLNFEPVLSPQITEILLKLKEIKDNIHGFENLLSSSEYTASEEYNKKIVDFINSRNIRDFVKKSFIKSEYIRQSRWSQFREMVKDCMRYLFTYDTKNKDEKYSSEFMYKLNDPQYIQYEIIGDSNSDNLPEDIMNDILELQEIIKYLDIVIKIIPYKITKLQDEIKEKLNLELKKIKPVYEYVSKMMDDLHKNPIQLKYNPEMQR